MRQDPLHDRKQEEGERWDESIQKLAKSVKATLRPLETKVVSGVLCQYDPVLKSWRPL